MPTWGMSRLGQVYEVFPHRKRPNGTIQDLQSSRYFLPSKGTVPTPQNYGFRWHRVAVYENEYTGRPASGTYSDTELQRQAQKFDMICAQTRATAGVYTPEAIATLKAVNTEMLVGVYVNGTHTPGVNGAPNLSKYQESWFAHQADGSYCVDPRWGNYMMEPSSVGWRNYITAEAKRIFGLSTYDFIFLDVMGWVQRNQVKPGTTILYTGLEWCQYTKLIARDVRVAIRTINPNATVESNGLKYGAAYFSQSYPLMEYSDTGMPEQFSRSSTAASPEQERTTFQVQKELDMVEDVHARGGGVDALTKDWRSTPDEERLRYGFGQFMLVATVDDTFSCSLGQAIELNAYSWLSDTDRGSPVGDYIVSGGVYQRPFTKGTVIVNSTATLWTGTVRGQAMTVPAYSSRWAMDIV